MLWRKKVIEENKGVDEVAQGEAQSNSESKCEEKQPEGWFVEIDLGEGRIEPGFMKNPLAVNNDELASVWEHENQAIVISQSNPALEPCRQSWGFGSQFVRQNPKEDTSSIQSELESIGLARTFKPITEGNDGSKGFMTAVMSNIRSFFTGW
jgi:hypothetical protein